MNEEEIQARFEVLCAQRNAALDQVVILTAQVKMLLKRVDDFTDAKPNEKPEELKS